jgi:hypothetical protein
MLLFESGNTVLLNFNKRNILAALIAFGAATFLSY